MDIYNGATTSYLDNVLVTNQIPTGVTHATHTGTSGYLPGSASIQTLRVTNSFEYPTNKMLIPLSLLWMPRVPPGWSLLTNTWGDGGPEVNTNDFEIVFKGSLAANPIVFYYQVSVPTNEMGVKYLSADVQYQFLGDDDPTPIVAEPNPLPLKMLLTVTANSTNKIYGTELTFAGTEFTASGLIGGDTVTNVTLTSAGSAASATTGVYAISAANAKGAGLTNYAISYINGALTVIANGPLPPTGLTASKGTYTDNVALSWTVSADAVGYEVWRNTSSDTGTATKISSLDVTIASYNDTDAANAVLYTYWVKTKGAGGAISVFSDSNTGWRGLLSPSVSASKGLRREVKVTWSVSPGATSYELWKNTVNESSSAKLLASCSATLYRDMQTIPGDRYYYWVKALCPLGDSGFGASAEGWCGAGKWDFNGDGRADVWYYHEPSGRWYVMMMTNVLSTAVLGGAGWAATPMDYDGDGKTDPAVYNRGDPSTGSGLGGTWKAFLSGHEYELAILTGFGGAGYMAAVGDYDGDGKADPAIYAESSGTWQVLMSANRYQVVAASGFGAPGYQAVPMDYDGDGKTDPAVYEEASGNWFMALSGNNYQISYVLQFGMSGYVPVPGEYEGLGYAQIAVYHEASGYWFIRTGSGDLKVVYFGMTGYVPMPADYDGDKHDDQCVFYRNRYDAIWYLLMSTEGFKMISGRHSRP